MNEHQPTKHLNLGILAHVDAGKTSLTERLLYTTGVINRIGSVDGGTTQTDTMAQERQRGITIRAAVVSFVIGDTTVNLIDTPGHPDFIAEVERVLNVLDGVVLVISAVEGIQAQTRVLMRTLKRLRIPTLLFVNKIDRSGAQHDRLLLSIADKLTPALVPMGRTTDLGTRNANFVPFGDDDPAFRTALLDRLVEHDDTLLAAFVADENAITTAHLRRTLARQTHRMLVHPVFFGSAITGAGVDALLAGIHEFLPAREGDADGPVSGTVFKIERGHSGEKIAYVRMFSGTIHVRERLRFGNDHEGKATALSVFERGTAVQASAVAAGQIGKVLGLGDVQIGDTIGARPTNAVPHYFAPPTLETVVVPRHAADRGGLHAALARLVEQDPLINMRRDESRQELFVSLYGEVQKEVIEETLRSENNIEVEWSETTTICAEKPCGTGEAIEMLGKGDNPFIAGVGLRVEAGAPHSGIVFNIEARVNSLPLYVYKSIEEFEASMLDTVRDTFQQGLYGWRVTDCRVTLTHCEYSPPSTSARDYRLLTPLVLMRALQEAGTAVYEPVHHFRLEIPTDTFGPMLPVLARLGATPQAPEMEGASCVLEGLIPADRVHELHQQLPGLTRGEGVLESAFEDYSLMRGVFPVRPRTDNNPLNWKEYMLHLAKRA